MNTYARGLILAFILAGCSPALPTGDDPTGIEGMNAAEVIEAMENLGLECSEPKKGLVNIDFACVETPNVVTVLGTAVTIDEVSAVSVEVADGNERTAQRLTDALLAIPSPGSDADTGSAWLTERFANGDCVGAATRADCSIVVGSARLSLSIDGSTSHIQVRLEGQSR